MVSYDHAGDKGPLSFRGQFMKQLANNCMETIFHVLYYLMSSAQESTYSTLFQLKQCIQSLENIQSAL